MDIKRTKYPDTGNYEPEWETCDNCASRCVLPSEDLGCKKHKVVVERNEVCEDFESLYE